MKKLQNLYAILTLSVFSLFANVASAAVLVDSTAVDAAYVDFTDTISYFEGKTWPLVFLVTGITIGIGLFKRFTRMGAR